MKIFAEPLPPLRWQDALDILIMAFVFYNLILLLRGTRAIQMLAGLGLLLAVSFAASRIGLHAVSWVLQNLLGALVLVVIILFQPELRRALANMGRAPLLRFLDPIKEERVLQECVRGTQALAAKRIGALIALQRETDLRAYVDGGVGFDARVSRELLFSIFLPASPVHDGAVLIQGNRLSQAGCFLPLSQNPDLPKDLGTRHRAAIGLSEETDAAVIVVSEETGAISLARRRRAAPGPRPAGAPARARARLPGRPAGGRVTPRCAALVRPPAAHGAPRSRSPAAFWFFVNVREQVEVGYLVPLVFERFPARLVLDGAPARGGLRAAARQPRRPWRTIDPQQLRVRVDLAAARAGSNVVPLAAPLVVVPRGRDRGRHLAAGRQPQVHRPCRGPGRRAAR